MAAPFQLLNFPMRKRRHWSEDDIALVARLLRGKVAIGTIANQFPNATVSDILEIGSLLGFRKPKYPQDIKIEAQG